MIEGDEDVINVREFYGRPNTLYDMYVSPMQNHLSSSASVVVQGGGGCDAKAILNVHRAGEENG